MIALHQLTRFNSTKTASRLEPIALRRLCGLKTAATAKRKVTYLSGLRKLASAKDLREILVNQKDEPLNIHEPFTADYVIGDPNDYSQHITSGRGVVEGPTYRRVHSPELQKLYQYAKENRVIATRNPLPKSGLVTMEVDDPSQRGPSEGSTYLRGVMTRHADGTLRNTPPPNGMEPVIITTNQPIDSVIPLAPHEFRHITTQGSAHGRGSQATHMLGAGNDIPVSYQGEELPIKNRLSYLAGEYDAIANSRALAEEWSKANVKGVTEQNVHDAAERSMRSKKRGYFYFRAPLKTQKSGRSKDCRVVNHVIL